MVSRERVLWKGLDLLFSGKVEEKSRPGEAVTAVPEVQLLSFLDGAKPRVLSFSWKQGRRMNPEMLSLYSLRKGGPRGWSCMCVHMSVNVCECMCV